MSRKGIDVSSHNGVIDWAKVKKDGVHFAMIRLGFGSDIKSQDDSQFERNVKECEKHGILWGGYLYSYALNVDDVKSEVSHIKRLMKGKKPSYPISFDMEDADGYKQRSGMPSNSTMVSMCEYALNEIEKMGYYASLYASLSWLDNQLKSSKLDKYDKWVAHWSPKCGYKGKFGMWQYTENGIVNGVSGFVDMNKGYSDFEKRKWNQSSNSTVNKLVKKYHVVKSGDVLGQIAIDNKTTIVNIMKLNKDITSSNKIYVNQKIRVK